jgi:hypothetical protein
MASSKFRKIAVSSVIAGSIGLSLIGAGTASAGNGTENGNKVRPAYVIEFPTNNPGYWDKWGCETLNPARDHMSVPKKAISKKMC